MLDNYSTTITLSLGMISVLLIGGIDISVASSQAFSGMCASMMMRGGVYASTLVMCDIPKSKSSPNEKIDVHTASKPGFRANPAGVGYVIALCGRNLLRFLRHRSALPLAFFVDMNQFMSFCAAGRPVSVDFPPFTQQQDTESFGIHIAFARRRFL
jgi:ribose/xylose/arabinose/galactoside ABC-type transport system permease subunit